MSKSHNKKRNTGLLYEFLVRTISLALVEGDKRRSALGLRLIKRHFKPGTLLHKEYRLINSLVKTTVSNEAVAVSILNEAKVAARSYDLKQLNREKSLLISAINKQISDQDFYDQPVLEYKTYATLQTLFNDWRSPDYDLHRLAQYEDQLVRYLVAEKISPTDQPLTDDSPGTGRLLMKVMMRKLNEKYSGIMSNEQRQLLRAYAFSTASDDPRSISLKLNEIKQRLLSEIDQFNENNSDINYINNKLSEARLQLESELLESVDDDTVTRFMLYTKLSSELNSEEDHD